MLRQFRLLIESAWFRERQPTRRVFPDFSFGAMTMAKRRTSDNSVCRNRKASFRFDILEKYECGLILLGSEVKSLREKACTLEEAYATLQGGELWLIGLHISPYSHAQSAVHDPLRRRKLLLHRREIAKIRPKVEQRGLTLVPLRIYFNERGIAKVTVGLAKGKRTADKRQDMRARDHKREMERATKSYR